MGFTLPTIPVVEILENMKEVNININEGDLKNPDPRRWRDIYAKIFEALTKKPIEQVIQSLFKVERMQTDCPDLFEEGFAQMAFTCCMQAVMSRFCFIHFTVKDVIQPTPKRVLKISNNFLNALRHVELRWTDAHRILENKQASGGQFESVLNRNKKWKEILLSEQDAQPARDAEYQELQQEFALAQQACLEVKRVQDEERRAVDEMKFQGAALDAEKESLKQQLGQVQQEVEKMSHKIVQSPKRFREELKRYKIKVDEMKTELGKKEQSLSDNRLLLEQTANKLTAVEKVVKLSKEVQGDQELDHDTDAEMHRLTEGLHEQKELYSSLCLQEEDLSEKLRVRQEQKHKLSSQIDVMEQSNYQQMADLIRHQEKMKDKLKNLEAEISQAYAVNATRMKEISDLDQTVEDEKRDAEKDLADGIAEVISLQQFVTEQWAEFKDIMLKDED